MVQDAKMQQLEHNNIGEYCGVFFFVQKIMQKGGLGEDKLEL